ncbi:MAG TPA: hypothetical protein VFB81_05200, partial [Myxococcales bacterium]|nr:hypothetical protein [Myxococcales bacterium]
MSGRASFILLFALAAGCATPRKWTAPPKASLSFEGAEAVAREMAKQPPAKLVPETGDPTTSSEAGAAAVSASAEAEAAPETPPAPEAPETSEASEGPGCPPGRVYADEFKNLIQASGCGRLFYLQKVPGKPGEAARWKRIGPEYQIAPQDDLHDAEVRLQGARLRTAVQTAGEQPLITLDQAK